MITSGVWRHDITRLVGVPSNLQEPSASAQLIAAQWKLIALELHFRPVIFVLVRAVVWSTLFVGVVLWFLPASVLAAAGIRGPASFGALQVVGIALGVVGLALAVGCVVAFAFVGRGTPAPFDPPRRLVVRGPYRAVRNPMYLDAGVYLAGFALFYRSTGVALYALAFLIVMRTFVVLYEEPMLRRTFGHDYEAYCERVGRWWPR
jgi:protein-S-isoprenylcysteine O-methyltransferase Ste14